MTRFVWTGMLAAAVGLWAGAGRAGAQPPAPPRLGSAVPPPGTSPYLNLLRGGSPAVNYYGLVRPQQYFQGAIQTLQTQQLATGPAPTAPADGSDLPGTGLPVGFMTHQVYFMNLGTGGPSFGTGLAPARGGASPLGAGVQAPPSRPAPRVR